MGVVTATIYVDTSFDGGVCQSGFYIYFNFTHEPYVNYSDVFESSDNNSAELKGIQLACDVAVRLIQSIMGVDSEDVSYCFKVFNDNITAVTVADSNYKPSKKANGRFKSTDEIKAWCSENDVRLKCIRKRRGDPIMKKCDKLSKTYRKEKFNG